jgi:hypothetical protein
MTAAPHPLPDPPSSTPRPPVARLRGPAELAAALPHLCGFVPTESLVVVALRGPRARVGLTMRVDLPPPAHEEPVVAEVVERVLDTGAGGAFVVVCTAAADDGDLPRARLVHRLLDRLRAGGAPAHDALLVRAGRWTSYLCADERCCPPRGLPLPDPASAGGLSLIAAEAVGRGRVVLADRDELVALVAAPEPDAAVLALLAAADRRRRARTARQGRSPVGRDALAGWVRALDAAPGRAPTPAEAAALVTALDDVVVRDAVLTGLLDDGDALLWLLLHLGGRTPSPHDAQLCAVLAWTAHARGDGALAALAHDRALAADPGCTLAQLGRQALEAQLDPTAVRAMVADSRRLLHAAHPWTRPAAGGGAGAAAPAS